MRSSNPVFRSLERQDTFAASEQASYRGITIKTGTLLLVAVITGFLFMSSMETIALENFIGVFFGAFIVALISVIIATRSVRLAMPFSLLYAAAEGVILSVITVFFEAMYPGVAMAALITTGAIFTVMLFLYSSRTIRVTSRYRRVMYTILISILVMSVISLFLPNIFFNPDSPFALVISGVLVLFGAFMLTLDFDRAEMIVESGSDRAYEWMVAVGLMVTIVWIYLELLRFLAILNSRRN